MYFFFFFKQKTAYEMLRSLVGSEMCIRDRVGEGQKVLEIGTCRGHGAIKMAEAGGRVLAVDKFEHYLEDAIQIWRTKQPSAGTIEFRCVDPINNPDRLAELQTDSDGTVSPFDVVFFDINGTRELETVLELLRDVLQVLNPPLTVIKSKRLFDVL
eukprot:TRINITY_DN15453_c0_g1_i2.p1 TRINITY_DN15453_c0_g1~~TRINITY_DN15453_c0_g1_i2.p1  ORF type:complete len:156 (+),score=50.03 TRINITY_DN15453_c0_g1_i2:52-519(+)